MPKNKKLILGGVVVALVLGLIFACSGGGMPSCDSGEVKDVLIKRLQSAYKPDFKVKLSDITTQSVDKETKKVTCEADTNIDVKMFGISQAVYLKYTAQRTSDGKLIVKDNISKY